MWADVMVDKVSTTLHLNHKEGKSSGSSVSFYLLPAVSEYCLLSAALIYEITVRIGQPSYIELEDSEDEDENLSDNEIHGPIESRHQSDVQKKGSMNGESGDDDDDEQGRSNSKSVSSSGTTSVAGSASRSIKRRKPTYSNVLSKLAVKVRFNFFLVFLCIKLSFS